MTTTKASIDISCEVEYVVDFEHLDCDYQVEFNNAEVMLIYQYRAVKEKYEEMLKEKLGITND